MAISSLSLRNRILSAVLAALIAPTAIGALIYTWEEFDSNSLNVSGMIEFADEISFGDIVDSTASIQAFDFLVTDTSGAYSAQFGLADITLNFLFLVDPGGLVLPSKIAVPKLPAGMGYFDLLNDDGNLSFRYKNVKKKAVKKKAGEKTAAAPSPTFATWFGDGSISLIPGQAEKKAAAVKVRPETMNASVEGQWVTASTALPEPASFGLMLIGLFAIGGLLTRRAR